MASSGMNIRHWLPAIRMAATALRTSVRITTTVRGPPKVRKKLVSPALPLPWVRTSSRRIYFETITAPLKQPQK